ncbi:MAG: T9SS type A sorting domain-containing protein [Candidatus Cloacimonetes bacterium]|nr:T9SS type A sorting domain-containing protein [Candidatus Cloacimonadota bacterium]
MRKMTILVILFVMLSALSAEVFPVKTDSFLSDITSPNYTDPQRLMRNIPDWEWNIPLQALVENYADYFQAYNETPVAVQPDGQGGIYIVYRVKNEEGESEIYYTYIGSDGDITTEEIGSLGSHCDAEIDELTGDPLVCWQGSPLDGSMYTDCFISYALYHLNSIPGAWKEIPITVIDNDTMQAYFPQENDEFVMPMVHIGPSPLVDNQRVYLMADNNHPSNSNVLLCYADFSVDSLDIQSDLEWQYTSIPQLDSLCSEDPISVRLYKGFSVSNNQVILFGYQRYNEEDAVDSLFCIINENYGEGEWQEYKAEWVFEEEQPTILPYLSASQNIMFTNQFNVIVTENGEKVMFPGTMGITHNQGIYNPLDFMFYPKTFSFDLSTHEFSFCDVYPMGADPNDDIPMKPWDLDEDGEIDAFGPQGQALWFQDWPIFHYDPDSAFHYNQSYLTANEENGWLAYIWVEGMNAKKANEGYEGFESWAEIPEIAICISDDEGYTWSDPIFMNANPESDNYQAELDGMIPCFVYPGDVIEDDGGGFGILHLFFLDDNDFGSFHNQQHGLNNGSTLEYASIRIDFNLIATQKNELVQVLSMIRNYPNPFNPETTIEFELQAAGEVLIDIYNIKGQKVCALTDDHYEAGKHFVAWNAAEQVSGLYFYKIRNGRFTTAKKMILMK